MSIVYVRKKLGREMSVGQPGDASIRTFDEVYLVRCSSPNEPRSSILGAPGLPQYGFAHSEDSQCVVVKLGPEQTKEDPCLYEVKVTFSTSTGNNPGDWQKPPDQRRPKWHMAFSPLPISRTRDLDGKPFVDRAGSPIIPPPDIPIYVDEVTVMRYEATINRAYDRRWLNATNSDTWLGAEPNSAKIVANDAEEVFLYGGYWFQRTIRILVSPRIVLDQGTGTIDNSYNQSKMWTEDTDATIVGGWNPIYVPNMGPRQLVNIGSDANNNPIFKPVPIENNGLVDGQIQNLDDKGAVIARKDDGTWSKALVSLGFRVVNPMPFQSLMLIPPWL